MCMFQRIKSELALAFYFPSSYPSILSGTPEVTSEVWGPDPTGANL